MPDEDFLRVMYMEELLRTPNETLLSEINFRRGEVMGYQAKVRELTRQLEEAEEKLDMAFDYQKEVDAQVVEKLYRFVDQDIEEIITFSGGPEQIIHYKYTYYKDPVEAIRNQ